MPERPATWDDLIRHEAQKARVPPQLALALMQQESGGQPDAQSPVGAQGLFQLMPETAKSLNIDPSDPLQNIRGGVTYLRQQLDATGGDVAAALARYHGGPNLALHGPKTSAYVQNVLRRLQAPAADARTASVTPEAAPPSAPAGRPAVGAPPPTIRPIPPRRLEETIVRPTTWPVGAPPPATGPSVMSEGGFAREMLEQVDPRTSTGRRNIAGGLGAAAAATAVAATAPVSVPVTALTLGTAGVLGATGAGMAAEAGEQLVGTAPPSTTSVLTAGAQQGVYEVAGQTLLWPVRAVGRRLIASKVGRAAVEGLARQKQTITDQARAARYAIVDQTQAAIRAAKDLTERTRRVLGLSLEAGVGTPPPAPSAAGRTAQRVISGPAQNARELAGQAVEAAAERGPDVDIRPLKAEAQRILEQEIKPSAVAFPRAQVEGPEAALAAAGVPPTVLSRLSGPNAIAAQEALAAAQAEGEKELLKHPAMGVLNRILNAEDDVSFAAAHAFKRELDEAVGMAWERSVSKRVTNITKTLRTQLRGALDYGPYNQATEAYRQIVPLYTKEIAPKLRKLAETEPEALIRMIKGTEPTPARMLRELLTTQAAAGGGGPEGRRAWDLVRSSWTHEKILRGGLDKLDDALGKLDPEFVDVFYGDAAGQQVLTNLRAIGTAYQQALAREPATIRAAKQFQTREQRQLVGATTQAMRELRATMTRFTESTLARKRLPGETTADILRAYFAFPGIWSGISIGRLLRGPAAADLLEWSIYSPQNTQRLVRALASPIPSMAVADLLRMALVPTVERVVRRPPTLPVSATRFSGVGAPPPPP